MKNNKFPQSEGDRVKIPMRFALLMGRDKSHIVRVNQGLRNLSLDSAARAVELFMVDGQPVTIFDVADIKADGGYVVAPPSIHPTTGEPYEWVEFMGLDA